jgi:tetratricopeptide (TPR) repeat protein
MKWISLALLTALAAAAQSPAEKAHALNNQGNSLFEQGNQAAAASAYREAIEIWRSLGSDYAPHLAGTMVNLGIAVASTGDRPASARLYEEALVLHRRYLGDKNYRTVTNMNFLATTWLMVGKPELAEPLLEEALAIERELYPADIQTARTLEAISNCMIRTNRHRQAVPPAEEALAIAIKATGEEHLDTALAYATVAEAQRYAGNNDRALPLFRKSRAIYAKNLGPEHPRVGSLYSQEGLILMQDNKLSLAGESMEKAVEIIRKSCSGCLLELAIAQNNLGILRLKQKRYREADIALTDAVAMREKAEARPSPELADALQSLAIARQNLRLFDDAARLNTRAREILSFR